MKRLKIRAEVYSRIAGYFRPVSQWNKGKAEEFIDRKVYDIDASLAKGDELTKSDFKK